MVKKSLTIRTMVLTQYRHRTDGHTDTNGISVSRCACWRMLTRDKRESGTFCRTRYDLWFTACAVCQLVLLVY